MDSQRVNQDVLAQCVTAPPPPSSTTTERSMSLANPTSSIYLRHALTSSVMLQYLHHVSGFSNFIIMFRKHRRIQLALKWSATGWALIVPFCWYNYRGTIFLPFLLQPTWADNETLGFLLPLEGIGGTLLCPTRKSTNFCHLQHSHFICYINPSV